MGSRRLRLFSTAAATELLAEPPHGQCAQQRLTQTKQLIGRGGSSSPAQAFQLGQEDRGRIEIGGPLQLLCA